MFGVDLCISFVTSYNKSLSKQLALYQRVGDIGAELIPFAAGKLFQGQYHNISFFVVIHSLSNSKMLGAKARTTRSLCVLVVVVL